MWTSRNLVALGLLLFAATFLWLPAAMAGRTPAPSGTAWTRDLLARPASASTRPIATIGASIS